MGWGVWEPLRKKKNSILPLGFLKTSNFNTLALNILRDRRGRILAMMTVPLFTHNFTYLLIITRHNTYLQIPHEAVKGQQWEWANKPKRKNNLIKKTKTMQDEKNMDKKEKMLCWDLNLPCYQPPAHEVSSLTTGLIALLNLLYLIHFSARDTVWRWWSCIYHECMLRYILRKISL